MTAEQVKAILVFWADIPKQVRLLNKEYSVLEDDLYNPLGAVSMDGMPHGSGASSKTENMALIAADDGRSARLLEIEKRKNLLLVLSAEIAAAMDCLCSTHKIILVDFYREGKSWEQISRKVFLSVRQCKNKRNFAIAELGRGLERSETVKNFFWKK